MRGEGDETSLTYYELFVIVYNIVSSSTLEIRKIEDSDKITY